MRGIFRYITLPIIEMPLDAGDMEVVIWDQTNSKEDAPLRGVR